MTKLLLLVLSVAALLTAVASVAASSSNSNTVQPPLHTSGPDIVDSTGARVRLRCANWYGAAEKDFVVGGLDLQPVDKIAGLIKAFGFNCVRLPYSVQMVLQDPPIQANVTTANPQLTGQSALQAYDAVVEALTSIGVMVIVDNHMSDANWCCSGSDGNGLWYTDRWSEADWLAAWKIMASRYTDNAFVVGADLRNELRTTVVHGQTLSPTWGSGVAATDWHAAATRAAAVVLAANSDLLIIVEGINYAGDLTGVAQTPIQLPQGHTGKLVYEAHNYQNFVHASSAGEFAALLDAAWGYVAQPGKPYTAPLWLGEFGTCHSPASDCFDAASGGGGGGGGPWPARWWQYLHAYISTRELNFGYWAIDGTQSRGTGRVAGAVETFGVLNQYWNGTAAQGGLLRSIQGL